MGEYNKGPRDMGTMHSMWENTSYRRRGAY